MKTLEERQPEAEPLAFLRSLEGEVAAHPAIHHPFLHRFSAERLTLEQIRAFGLQHYQLVRVFTTYMTQFVARLPKGGAPLRGVFEDEFGQYTLFRSHVHLYRNFLKALGLQDEEWGGVALRSETRAFIQGHLSLTQEGDVCMALGAIGPGHEFAIPLMFEQLLAGLRRSTTLRESDLEYFSMHIEEDVDHAVAFNELISQVALGDRERALVRQGARASLGLRSLFWDGCSRAVFGGTP